MPTLRFVLRKNKQRRDGTIPLYLRITEDRKSRFITTGIALEEKDWNDARQEVRRSHELSVRYNDELKRLRSDAEKTSLELKQTGKRASATAVKKELRGEGASHVIPYAEALAEEQVARGKFWQDKKIRVLVAKLKEYHGSGTLTFSEIDHAYLVGFERFMRVKKKNKTNTVAKNLQMLQMVIKRAIQEELIPAGHNPFLFYSVRSEAATKDKLSLAEIQKLEGLALPGGSPLAITRDAFLFSFYCAGIRFGDLCRLQWKHVAGGRITYRMAKTGTSKSIKLPEPASVILARYAPEAPDAEALIFPLLRPEAARYDEMEVRRHISSKNVAVNRDLKKLAAMIETNAHLSFHVSRHSFADYARTSGVDLYAISKALGHSNLKITETYLKSFDHASVDGALDRLFGTSPEQPAGEDESPRE